MTSISAPAGISVTEQLAIAIPALAPDISAVLLYDAEQAPSAEVIDVLLDGVGTGGEWCVSVLDMTETVKIVDAGDRIAGTLDRDTVLRLRSPQAATRTAVERVLRAKRELGWTALPSYARSLGIPISVRGAVRRG